MSRFIKTKISVQQSSPPVQFVDYCSACLVKDWCKKKIAPSGFLDVIFNCHITGEIVD